MSETVNCSKCKTNYSCIQTGKCERIPIDNIIRLAPHWFSTENKRFFKSKWNNYAYQLGEYAYFISSEKHVNYFVGINDPRKYTIRKFNMNTGEFSTDNKDIFNFQRYKTKRQAEKALSEYLKEASDKALITCLQCGEIYYSYSQFEESHKNILKDIDKYKATWLCVEAS